MPTPLEGQQPLARIVNQALSLPPSRRAAFLIEVSSGDDDLLRHLEALLAAEEGSSGVAAGSLAPDDSSDGTELAAGRMIGGYRLLGRLGRGAMGEVYLAEDTRLRRNVALKLLPPRLTGHPQRVTRFQREARTASALNHPSILTIHDFGEHDGRHYIASELVEGRTLRELIRDGGVDLPRAVDMVTQVAQALAAAHEAGIVHRDIKPENVMLRPDGFVKLLDFGLAKLTALDSPADETDLARSTPSAFETQAGSVLGTVTYMSPEQARGENVDPRSDLFSLGVVLYELVAGRRPFEGATPSRVLDAILNQEPPALPVSVPAAPETLQRVVRRALAKAREDRYQTARELLADLKVLKQELELDARSERQGPMTGSEARAATSAGARGWLAWIERPTVVVAAVAIGAAALVLLWSAAPVHRVESGGKGRPLQLERMQMTKLTSTGDVLGACISPDGKYAAYVLYRPDGASLWIKELATGSNRQIVPPGPVSYWSFTFTPDSRSIYYVSEERSHRVGGVLRSVPVAGGTPRALIVRINGISIAPDGRRLLFKRSQGDPPISTLLIASADGRGEEVFAVGGATREILTFAWSPDGDAIAYAFSDEDAAGTYWQLVARPVAGGPERTIIDRRRREIGGLAFLPDGSGLVISAEDEFSAAKQLWHVSYPDGAMTRITHDLNHYGYPILTADGNQLLTVQQARPARIWVAPLDDPGRARPLMAGTGEYGEVAWTREGRLVYVDAANGEWNLWVMDTDGGNAQQLTRNARVNFMPDVSADGRYIVFLSTRTGDRRLWRMDADGRNPVQLGDDDAWHPQCAPDGSVVYERMIAGKSTVWKVPIDGGVPVQLTDRESARPTVSPDGRWLAYEYFDETARLRRVAVHALAGGPPVKVFDLEAGWDTLRFSADGAGLVFVSDSNDGEILLQPLAGGPPMKLLASAYESVFAFALSRDGRQIAYTAGHLTSDVILFRNLR